MAEEKTKPTIASDWLGGCAGCHMSLLDMDERLLALLEKASLGATPITDLKSPPPEGVDVGILEGAVTNTANEEVALRMRARCKCLVALGDCAVFGGLPTLRNKVDAGEALRRAYVETESTTGGDVPHDQELARPMDPRPVSEVVDVDVFVPGCPPPADAIFHALKELAEGRLPQLKGALLDWH